MISFERALVGELEGSHGDRPAVIDGHGHCGGYTTLGGSTVLRLEAADFRVFFAGLPAPVAGVDLGLDYPPAQRLRTHAFLTGNGRDRLRVRRILRPVLQHEPHGPLTHLGIDHLWHDAILSTQKEAAPNLRRFNHQIIGWAGDRDVFFTRSRPYKSNDQATIESKNGHLVRRYGFYHRYDTPAELDLLTQLWPLVNDRLNFFTPTKKPIGYGTDKLGRRKRLYDQPRSPYRRLLEAGVLSPAQEHELAAYKATLKPTRIARQITELQAELTRLAATKTRRLEDQLTWRAPDIKALKIRAG